MDDKTLKSLTLAPKEKRQIARVWLKQWVNSNLPLLRVIPTIRSKYFDDVTLVLYSFLKENDAFSGMEFSILQSWKVLGQLRVVIVCDKSTAYIEAFRSCHPSYVNVQIEPSLIPGDIMTMTEDCVSRLHSRFSTPYCLIIQDDGFPVNDHLERFLGKYDYIGSPSVRDVPAQYIVDITRCVCMNGGFSLRSHRICTDVARQWRFWRHFIHRGDRLYSEDAIYSHVCCLNPLFRLRNRFPSSKTARCFSLPDFDGVVDIRGRQSQTFGIHGPTAIWQLFGNPTTIIK